MMILIKKRDEQNWNFQTNPFFDWIDETVKIFGNWQGGPYNRWSPSGISDIKAVVGPHLQSIVSVLKGLVDWIDSNTMNTNAEDISMHLIKNQLAIFCKNMNNIVNCEFNMFRMGVFITMINGCGITRPGKHLRQISIPVRNTASFEHLLDPSGDSMSYNQSSILADSQLNSVSSVVNDGKFAGVKEGDHDDAMRALSQELGMKEYFRDFIECILCKSKHSRHLHKKEWFCRYSALFDIDENGYVIFKNMENVLNGKCSNMTKI